MYSFVEKQRIDLRNCFHLNIEEWKDKKQKNTPKNPLIALAEGGKVVCFTISGCNSKKLVTDEDHENEKKIPDKQKQKEMEEKNKKEKKEYARLWQENKELRQIKKAEKLKQDEKEMWA